MSSFSSRLRALLVCLAGSGFLLSGADSAAIEPHPPGLQITVVEGQGAINNARAHTAREPVVEVRDQDGAPVNGAVVTFQTPASGPSGLFATGQTTFITQTDSAGRAVGRGLRPNAVKGQFPIHVTATSRGLKAAAVVVQTNALPAESKSSKKVWLIGLIAGGAAGGAFAAAHGGKSNPASPPPAATGTLVPGTPNFGPPH